MCWQVQVLVLQVLVLQADPKPPGKPGGIFFMTYSVSNLHLISPPAGTLHKELLQAVRNQRGKVTDSDDLRLLQYIKAALAYCENYSNRCFEERVWEEQWVRIPCFVRLKNTPVSEIVHYKFYNPNNVLTDFTDYKVSMPTYQSCRIESLSQPATYYRPDAVQIRYKAKWIPLPDQAFHSIMLLVSYWDQQRDAVLMGTSKEVEFGVHALLDQIRYKG